MVGIADGDSEKMGKENGPFNNSTSSTDGPGLQPTNKFQPIRVQALLEMSESDDDDDDEIKHKDVEDEESESDDDQPLPRDGCEPKPELLPDTRGHSKLSNNNLKSEKVVEESERHSMSKSLATNVREFSSTKQESRRSCQATDSRREQVSNDSRSLFSKESSHNERTSTSSIKRISTTGFSSDFVKLEFDIKTGRSAGALTPSLSDSVVKKSEESVPRQPYKARSSDIKFEAQDKSRHSATAHKPDHRVSNSMGEVPSTISHGDLAPASASSSFALLSSYLTSDTPLKNNPPPGSTRPVPSHSHKNLFETPQNKELSNCRRIAPTPATILSHWTNNNVKQTPLQDRAPDSILPARQSLSRYRHEPKSVRRPLAETMVSDHRPVENPSYKKYEGDNHNQNQQEVVHDKPLRPSTQESKENKRSTSLESTMKKEDSAKIPGSGDLHVSREHHSLPPPIMSSRLVADSAVKKEPTPRPELPNSNHKTISPEAQPLREHNPNQSNVPSRPTVQASVPSSIKKPQYDKTITVKGREYMVLGHLGQGMSGTVIRVQDFTNMELKAIKMVDLSRMEHDARQSCVQEISMLHKLQAPCIIKMFDYEIRGHMIYVVMEMGETDLSRFLKILSAEKRPPLTMILYYWTEMLTAVKHIHDNGVIHSDLKPANFLLVRGRLKLIDFGIASTLNADMTSVLKHSTVGTLNYISPEALKTVDESTNQDSIYKINYKSDVWSLGCILYSLVYGRTPFQHIQNHWAKINAITNAEFKISFTQPAHAEPVPSFLIDVIRQCLQRDPKARPSVAQLLEVCYIPSTKPSASTVDLPSYLILKIKRSLSDDEWREFAEIMDQRRKA